MSSELSDIACDHSPDTTHQNRMEAATEPVACTMVSVEEVLRGWLAIIHRLRDVHRQLPAYDRLGQLFGVLRDWEIAPFDKRAADQFTILRRQHIRIGTMDLKIAATVLRVRFFG